MVKFIHPIFLCLNKSIFQNLQESLISDFYFIVSLRMLYRSKLLSDAKFLAKLAKSCATKLATIIYNYYLGKTILTNDRYLDNVPHPSFCDMGEWFGFDPFG